MKIIELARTMSVLDFVVLVLSEKGLSGDEIATLTDSTRQTVHNIKKRHEELISALGAIKTEEKEFGNPDINLVVNTFMKEFDTTKTSKYDRFAAKRLSDKHGAAQIAQIIKLLRQASEDKYAPSVNNISEFEIKWPKISNYFRKRISDGQTVDL